MSYASSALQNSANENIKSAILGHFSSQDINSAKDTPWEKSDVAVIGDKLKRRDSSVRSEKEANVHDLMVALAKLDNSDLIPTFAVTAAELHKIPKFKSEEIISTSIVQSLVSLENKFSLIQITVDRFICENLEIRDRLNAKTSYALVLATSDVVPQLNHLELTTSWINLRRQVVLWGEETSTYSWSMFCIINCRPSVSNY